MDGQHEPSKISLPCADPWQTFVASMPRSTRAGHAPDPVLAGGDHGGDGAVLGADPVPEPVSMLTPEYRLPLSVTSVAATSPNSRSPTRRGLRTACAESISSSFDAPAMVATYQVGPRWGREPQEMRTTVAYGVPCPECGAPARVTRQLLLDSTDGPIEHLKTGLRERALAHPVDRDGQAGAAGRPGSRPGGGELMGAGGGP